MPAEKVHYEGTLTGTPRHCWKDMLPDRMKPVTTKLLPQRKSTLTTEYTFFRYKPVMRSHISGERHDALKRAERKPACKSGTASWIAMSHHSMMRLPPKRRLGENHGGV